MNTWISFILVPIASAQDAIITGGIPGCDFATGQLDKTCPANFLAYLIQFLFSFIGAACLIVIVISGFQIVLGSLPGGNKEGGKTRLKWAIIGFIVSALAFFIIDFIIATIGG